MLIEVCAKKLLKTRKKHLIFLNHYQCFLNFFKCVFNLFLNFKIFNVNQIKKNFFKIT